MSPDAVGTTLGPREGMENPLLAGMADRAGWEAHQNAYHEAYLNRHAAFAQMVRPHLTGDRVRVRGILNLATERRDRCRHCVTRSLSRALFEKNLRTVGEYVIDANIYTHT